MPISDDDVPKCLTPEEREAWEACRRAASVGFDLAKLVERRSDVDACVKIGTRTGIDPGCSRYVYVETGKGVDPDHDTAEPFESEGWRVARAIATAYTALPAALRSLAEARAALLAQEWRLDDMADAEECAAGCGAKQRWRWEVRQDPIEIARRKHAPSCIYATIPRPEGA